MFDFMDSIGNVAGYSKYLLIPSDPGRFDKQLAEIADRAVRRSSFDAMRPAALAPADGPVGAVEHGSEFFNGIERPNEVAASASSRRFQSAAVSGFCIRSMGPKELGRHP